MQSKLYSPHVPAGKAAHGLETTLWERLFKHSAASILEKMEPLIPQQYAVLQGSLRILLALPFISGTFEQRVSVEDTPADTLPDRTTGTVKPPPFSMQRSRTVSHVLSRGGGLRAVHAQDVVLIIDRTNADHFFEPEIAAALLKLSAMYQSDIAEEKLKYNKGGASAAAGSG